MPVLPMELGHGLGRFRWSPGTKAACGGTASQPPRSGFARAARASGRITARPRKRLKDLCQEAGIVPWMRERLPLVFVGERLAAVGDLWIDADFAAGPGEPALKPGLDGAAADLLARAARASAPALGGVVGAARVERRADARSGHGE